VFSRQDVRFLAPIPRPNSLRDFSVYVEHGNRAVDPPRVKGALWCHKPPYYKGNPDNIFGPDDPFIFPSYTDELDLEFEIGIVIGRPGTNLSLEDAKRAIAGYTILIDSSARDRQREDRFGPAKGKDFGTTLGPYLVTADEVDEANLHCRFLVDGEVWWEGSTSEPRSFLAHHLVAYTSDHEPVFPGDVIGTGTIGVSCSVDTKRWIKVGQRARFEVEGLGVLDQVVVGTPSVVNYVRDGMDGLIVTPST
jgi:2-keto-4-pentenoate hydratase/2-oxohepta-3-ene-1,7-dioic acid hydratase in catechol pathway